MFVVSLARASRRARRHLRGLEKADREDILATAILWCWENRATYNPAILLDDWFVGAIRDARKAVERDGERHTFDDLLAQTSVAPDDTAWSVETRQAIGLIFRSMDERDKRIVRLSMEGMNQESIAELIGVPVRTIKRKLARIRAMVPERENFKLSNHTAPSGDSDSHHSAPRIDKEIAKLEFAPPAGKDCPPCWRCKWFDGYVPPTNTARRAPILMEPEIRAAVLEVEARKIDIAYGLRK
jgi:RNA polymerase sigma factor (sigma-70 family)